MAYNMHELVSSGELNNISEQKLIKLIEPFKNNINEQDQDGRTPIMLYCILHGTESDILVIQTMISKFYANVNIPDHDGKIPLDIYISMHAQTMNSIIEIINLLLRYTSLQALVFRGTGESITERMFKSTSLFKAGVLKQLLHYYTLSLPSNKGSPFEELIKNFYFQIVLIIPYVQDEIMLRNILDNIKYPMNNLYENKLYDDSWFNVLLCEAIHLENTVLVKVLLSQDSEYKTRSDVLDFIKKHPEMEQLIVDDIRMLKMGTIIFQQFIRIEELNKYQALSLKINGMIQSYLLQAENQDLNVLKVALGFSNNIFHAIALDKTITEENCFKIFQHSGQRIEYLFEHNSFGHRPLYNAVFIRNINFLKFYAKVTAVSGVDVQNEWIVDKYGNNVAHILARIKYDETVEYLLHFFNAAESALPFKNYYGQSALCDAIIFRNIPFIEYWERNHFAFTERDKCDNSLWHYYVISGYEPQASYRVEESLVTIHEKLKLNIQSIVCNENAIGITPFQLGIETLRVTVLELLLYDFHKQINFTAKDNEGRSISHIMAMNFVKNYHNNLKIAAMQNIVNLLIPFSNEIEKNYYKDSESILDILTQNLGEPLWSFISMLFQREMLRILQQKGYQRDHDDDLLIRVNGLIQAAISKLQIQDLSKLSQNTIKALQFDIVFGKINIWNDNLINVLITKDHIGFTKDYMIRCIIGLLSSKLKQYYMNMYNKIGQLPVHIAAESTDDIIDYFLLLDINSINRLTFSSDRALHPINVLDYTIILNDSVLLKRLIRALINAKLELKQSQHIVLKTSFLKKLDSYLSEHEVDELKAYNIGISSQELPSQMNEHQFLAPIKARQSGINTRSVSYYSVNNALYSYILNNNYYIKFTDTVYTVTTVELFKEILISFHTSSSKIILLAFLFGGHASAAVVTKKRLTGYNAYLQDSSYTTSDEAINIVYKTRFDSITKIMYEVLNIPRDNIHELLIPQQVFSEFNCGIWTLANLKLMAKSIKSKFSVVTLDSMQRYVSDNAEQIVIKIQKKLWDQYQKNRISYHATLQTSPSLENPQNSDVLKYTNQPLSYNLIQNIVYAHHANVWSVDILDSDYLNSQHGIAIIEDSVKLKNHITDFFEMHKSEFMTRTFIVHQQQDEWVTLILIYNDLYSLYYIDPLNGQKKITLQVFMDIVKNNFPTVFIQCVDLSLTQTTNRYDSGIFAIEDALCILHILKSEPKAYHQAKLSTFTNDHPINVQQLRKKYLNEIEDDIKYQQIINALSDLEIIDNIHNTILGIRNNRELMNYRHLFEYFEHAIGVHGCHTNSNIHRAKRDICDEVQDSQEIQHKTFEEDARFTNSNSVTTLYTNMALLLSFKDKNINQWDIVVYIQNIGNIINEGSDNQSQREIDILRRHYSEANSFIKDYVDLLHIMPHTDITLDVPALMYNGKSSLLVHRNNDNCYMLYSPDYNYSQIFKTSADIAFSDIINFANAFFAYHNSGNSIYDTFVLSDNINLHNAALDQLHKLQILHPHTVLLDIHFLFKTSHPVIEDIPVYVVLGLFLINDKVPDVKMLNSDFFLTNSEVISLRIHRLHTVLLSLNDLPLEAELVPSLKKLIHKYKLRIDETYLNKIPIVVSDELKDLMHTYHDKVMELLQSNIENLTLQKLSKLSWDVLEEKVLTTLLEMPELGKSTIYYMKKIHKAVANTAHKLGHTTTQALFFVPDIIKSINYKDYTNLGVLGTITTGDMTLTARYNALIDYLAKQGVVSSRIDLLKRMGSGLVGKMLIIFSTFELLNELKKAPNKTEALSAIYHELGEQVVTVGLMIAEICSAEVTPLWIGLFTEQILYDAEEINTKYQTDIPVLEGLTMYLGWKQQAFKALIYKVDMIEKNFNYYSHNDTNLVIIKIPNLDENKQYRNITEKDIPQKIIDRLRYNGYLRLSLATDSTVSPMRWEDPESEYVFVIDKNNTAYYQRIYYNAYPVNSNMSFDYYTDQTPSNNYALFTDRKHYNNITWSRIPTPHSDIMPILWPASGIQKKLPRQNDPMRMLSYDTGNTALYWHRSSLKNKKMKVIFDPYEGNLNIKFTTTGIKYLNAFFIQYTNVKDNDNINIIIAVTHKYKDLPYLIFNDMSHGNFTLVDDSNKIISHYYISDDLTKDCHIDDNTYHSYLIFLATKSAHNTNDRIVMGSVGQDVIKMQNSNNITCTLVFHNHKILNLLNQGNNYFIDYLIFNTAHVLMHRVCGTSEESLIHFTKKNHFFSMQIICNIIIKDNNVSTLHVLGEYDYNQSAHYSKLLLNNINTHYTVAIQNSTSFVSTIERLKGDGIQHIRFKDNNVQYNWYISSINSTVRIVHDNHQISALSSKMDMIHYFDSYYFQEVGLYIHYYDNSNPNIVLDLMLTLENIFLRNQAMITHDQQHFIHNINYILSLQSLKFIINQNYCIFLFTDHHMNDQYHVVPNCETVTINNEVIINDTKYYITIKDFCAVHYPQTLQTVNILKGQALKNLIQTIVQCRNITIFDPENTCNNNAKETIMKSSEDQRNITNIPYCTEIVDSNLYYIQIINQRTARHIQNKDDTLQHSSQSYYHDYITKIFNIPSTLDMPHIVHHQHRHHHGQDHCRYKHEHKDTKYILPHHKVTRDIDRADNNENTLNYHNNIVSCIEAETDHAIANAASIPKPRCYDIAHFVHNSVKKIKNWLCGSNIELSVEDNVQKKSMLNIDIYPDKNIYYNITKHNNVHIVNHIVEKDLITNNSNTNQPQNLVDSIYYTSNSNNSTNIQTANTLMNNGTLLLGHIISHRFFGKNKLLQNSSYISPEQAQSIRISELKSAILPIVNHGTVNVDDFISHYNSAPQWYQNMYKKQFDEIAYTQSHCNQHNNMCQDLSRSDSVYEYNFSVCPIGIA